MKFDHFMSLKGVVTKIKTRVHNFFELIWQFQVKTDSQTQKSTIQKLPLSIQQDLLSQISFSHQLNFPTCLPQGSQIQKILSFKLKTYIVDPNATIYSLGSPLDAVGEGYVYYVRNGLAKYYFEFRGGEHVIALSNVRKLTGEYEFVTGLGHCCCFRAIDLCVIERVSYGELRAIVRGFGLEEEMAVLRCQVLLYGELKLVEIRCMICDKNHTQNQCSTIMPHHDIKQQYQQSSQKTTGTTHPRRPYPRKSPHPNPNPSPNPSPSLQHPKAPSRTKITIPHTKLKQKMRLKKHQSFAYKNFMNLELMERQMQEREEMRQRGDRGDRGYRYAESLYWNVDVMMVYERYYPEWNVAEEAVYRSVAH